MERSHKEGSLRFWTSSSEFGRHFLSGSLDWNVEAGLQTNETAGCQPVVTCFKSQSSIDLLFVSVNVARVCLFKKCCPRFAHACFSI